VSDARPRLGVLGGTFDPPHVGHLAIASEAHAGLGLQHVLFVTAAAPPHKEGRERTPAGVRIQLTELAVEDDIRFLASTIEVERDLVYTVDLLSALAERRPDNELVFIMGSDSLLQLGTWHEPEKILDLCTLAVAPRPGDSPEAIREAAARWGGDRTRLLDVPPLAVSSSDIRARVEAGRPIRYLVPRPVEERIVELGLYR